MHEPLTELDRTARGAMAASIDALRAIARQRNLLPAWSGTFLQGAALACEAAEAAITGRSAREFQDARAERLATDGWKHGPHSDARKTTPVASPFASLDAATRLELVTIFAVSVAYASAALYEDDRQCAVEARRSMLSSFGYDAVGATIEGVCIDVKFPPVAAAYAFCTKKIEPRPPRDGDLMIDDGKTFRVERYDPGDAGTFYCKADDGEERIITSHWLVPENSSGTDDDVATWKNAESTCDCGKRPSKYRRDPDAPAVGDFVYDNRGVRIGSVRNGHIVDCGRIIAIDKNIGVRFTDRELSLYARRQLQRVTLRAWVVDADAVESTAAGAQADPDPVVASADDADPNDAAAPQEHAQGDPAATDAPTPVVAAEAPATGAQTDPELCDDPACDCAGKQPEATADATESESVSDAVTLTGSTGDAR